MSDGTGSKLPGAERSWLLAAGSFTLAAPLILWSLAPEDGSLRVRFAWPPLLWWPAAALVLFGVSRLLSPLSAVTARALLAVARWGGRRPHLAVVTAAVVAALISVYPVAFLGRSLVSPNNGGVPLLYPNPPWTPGSDDVGNEPTSNADVGSMMWALLPNSVVERAAFRDGEWPLWNRYNGAGRPLWGQGQTFLLSPLHLPVLVSPDLAVGWDLEFILHRIVFAVAVGLTTLTLTASWPAAAAMAAAAPFTRQYLFRLNHPAQFALTFAPFVFQAWLLLAAAVRVRELARAAAWLGLATALVLVASPPKEAVVMLICAHAAGGLAVLLAPASLAALGRQLGFAAAGLGAAVLLTAPQWLLFLDTLEQAFTVYDRPAVSFASWIAPVSFTLGTLSPGVLIPGIHALAVAAFAAGLAGGRRIWSDRFALAALAGPGLAAAVAFGVVPAPVLLRLPLIAHIGQIDYTFVQAAIPLVLVAGGLGVRAILEGRLAGPTAAVAAAIAGVVWLMLSNLWQTAATTWDFDVWLVILFGVLAIVVVPTAAIAARRWPDPQSAIATAFIAAAILAPTGLHAGTGVRLLDDRLVQPRPRPSFEADSPSLAGLRAGATEPARVIGLDAHLAGGSQSLYGLEGIGGADALVLPRFEQLLNVAGLPRVGVWEIRVSGDYLPALAPTLDLLGVGHAIASVGSIPVGFSPVRVAAPDRVRDLIRPHAWPRAFFVPSSNTYASMGELVEQIRAGAGPFATIDAADQVATAAIAGLPRTGTAVAVPGTGYTLTANTTTFHIRAPGPGVVVLTEAWMAREFEATVNEATVPYFRVNHAFKGVRIAAAGDYIVRFRYRPARLGLTVAMAVAGLLLLAVLAGAGARRPTDAQ